MSKVDGIVRHHGSFRHGSIFCMLLEYANKGNLEQYLQICQPPVTTLDILTFWRSFFSLLDVLIALSRITYEGDDVNYQMCVCKLERGLALTLHQVPFRYQARKYLGLRI